MELTWQQFRNKDNIRILTESEQMRQYRFYLEALSNERFRQNKGPGSTQIQTPTQPAEGFLLQEDGDYLLQEDGTRILL